jgi:hypothetical protein
MAHVVIRQPLTAEARILFQCSPRGGQSTNGEFFLPVLQVSSVIIIPPLLQNTGQKIKKKNCIFMNMLLIYLFASMKLEKGHKNYLTLVLNYATTMIFYEIG